MRHRRWLGLVGAVALVATVALALVACGPEGSRSRDGGTGGSSRGAVPPTTVGDPSLAVKATMNIPYATSGPLPTLRPAAPGTVGTPSGNPVATANPTPQQPGAASPTATR